MQFEFEKLPVPSGLGKPRSVGVTMMIDWGMGLGRQADTLDSSGLYIDVVKIAGSIPCIMPREMRVKTLGTEVNLANVEWDELYITEMVRRGMAGDTSHPQGAYRLAGFEAGHE